MCDDCCIRLLPDLRRLNVMDQQIDKAELLGNVRVYNLLTDALMTGVIAVNLKLAECKKCEHLVDPHAFSQ